MLGNSGGYPVESGGSSGGDAGIPPETDRISVGGNRWPLQETAALIKIRTDMDVPFRDSCQKGLLWDEVSRKLAELGYHRSAKKCKEKFENVFKYHKRTKDGRNTESGGKIYPFSDQLETLDGQPPPRPLPQSHEGMNSTTISSTQNLPQSQNPISIARIASPNSLPSQQNPFSTSFATPAPMANQDPPSVISSSSASSDRETERRGSRKRKWTEFFDRLTSEVMQRQEHMQRKFLEALEKREQERVAREEAWRAQELARMSREREMLAQERAISAAKDAAIYAFFQKMAGVDQQISDQPQPPPPPPPVESIQPTPLPQLSPQLPVPVQQMPQPPVSALTPPVPMLSSDDRGEIMNFSSNPSSSRWPKAEIEALIKLRTNLDIKYQENTLKGPLWDEISAGMLRLGYNRNPKRCKEKWENINKYYKKVKESNKKRPGDSKTCPYFDQLEAIYRERAMTESHFRQENAVATILAQMEQLRTVQNRPELQSMEGHDSDDDEDEDEDEEDEAAN